MELDITEKDFEIFIFNNENQLQYLSDEIYEENIFLIISKEEEVIDNFYYIHEYRIQELLDEMRININDLPIAIYSLNNRLYYEKLKIHLFKSSRFYKKTFSDFIEIQKKESTYTHKFKNKLRDIFEIKNFFWLDSDDIEEDCMLKEQSPKYNYEDGFEEIIGDNFNSKDILNMLIDIKNQMTSMQQEMRSSFAKVISQLNSIQAAISERKNEYREELLDINEQVVEDQFILDDISKIRSQLDQELYKGTIDLIECVDQKPVVRISRYPYLFVFEEKGKSMIESCMMVEKLISKNNIEDFDYSLCSAGYWKAIEIELNIIVADTLRYIKKIVTDIPSEGVSQIDEPVNIYAGYIQVARKKKFININKKEPKGEKLKSLMFGELISILENQNQNEMKNILTYMEQELHCILNYEKFIMNFVADLKVVIYDYRNQYSHTGKMTNEQFINLKQLLFNENGLLHRVSNLKKASLEMT